MRISTALRRRQRLQDGVKENTFRHSPFDTRPVIDDGAGDGENAKPVDEVGKFRGFNAISAHKVAFHGELVRQAHGRRAMGSGGGSEDLQVKRLSELGELFAAFGL